MRKIFPFGILATLVIFLAAWQPAANAQEKEQKSATKKEEETAETKVPKEESSVTEHTIRLGGQTIPYKATAQTILIKDEKGEPEAMIYSTAYTRTDVKDLNTRPIAFLYNGGPGSSSIWLHMGAFGPKRVVTVNAEATPPAPYKMEDNANCLLDKADLVFIDPVGTGFSHAVGKAKDKDFWGVDQDVKSLAQFISIYVTRNNRWNSPKFLIGESYGTFRSAALGNYLQQHDSMYLNGIVLISSVLDLGTISFYPGNDAAYIYYLPSYAATAWYHRMLKNRPDDLAAFVEAARKFAYGEYASALLKGDKLSDAEKTDVAQKLSSFTGLSTDYLMKANLRVKLGQFREELQRSGGLVTGRLDARFSGPTYDPLAEMARYDPQETAITGPFVAEFNNYVREDLKFGQGKTYEVESNVAGREWDWKREGGRGEFFPGAPNVEQDLVQAMISNVHLKVQIENGYFDLATPFLATEHTVDHLDLPPNLQKNIELKYYDAGHMMYLHDPDLANLKNNIANFIESAAGQ
jgi:carboxypeptidase C (cathepsin A)